MVCGTTLKLAIISFITIYTSYLFFYKCEKIGALETFLHPLNSHHSYMCDGVNKAEQVLTPYGHKLSVFLDDNVHNTEFFKKYEIHEKLVCAYNQGLKVVHPVATKIYEFIEIGETKAYDGFVDLYNYGLKTYHDLTK